MGLRSSGVGPRWAGGRLPGILRNNFPSAEAIANDFPVV
jgi:hypothetical protein